MGNQLANHARKCPRSTKTNPLLTLFLALLLLFTLYWLADWYFSLPKKGKRRFWVVVVLFLLLSLLWEKLLLPALGSIKVETL
jgi:hypothetical protein